MKLLFVLPEYGDVGGGIATFYRHLLPEFVAGGHRVDVCVASERFSAEPSTQPSGVRVFGLSRGAIASASKRLNGFAAVPDLQKELATAWAAWEGTAHGDGYDVVETSDFGMLFAPWAANGDRPPVAVQLHSSNGQISFHEPLAGHELAGQLARLVEGMLLPRVEELQTYGGPNAQEWEALFKRPVHHIYPVWSLHVEPDDTGGDCGTGNAIVVGRVQNWKGPRVLCEALRALGGEAPVVDWVGRDTSDRKVGRSMAAALTDEFPEVWGQKVRWCGLKPASETAQLQRAASAVIVPSTWDVFNLTAIEGMAARRVVICSTGAGAAGLIEDGVNGFRFTGGDSSALADALSRFGQLTATQRCDVGEAARDTVRTVLSPERIVPQRVERYRKLAAGEVSRPAPHPWCETFFGSHSEPNALTFLDRLPFRSLFQYGVRRCLGRFTEGRR